MSGTPPSDSDSPAFPEIDTTVASSARIYDYWLGGKDHYPVDLEMGEQIRAVLPGIVEMARDQRAFLVRMVTYLAREAGIRQFLDIGTGLPTANNTHEVAQRIAPEARIVYVDNDPVVLVHARALLTSTPQGATDYIDADLREPDTILQAAARTLDFDQPVAITLLGVVHHVPDTDAAHAIVQRLLDAVPSGSYLVISHTTSTVTGAAMEEAVRLWNQAGSVPIVIRSPKELAGFFERLELVEPGVVSTTRWRPDPGTDRDEADEASTPGRTRGSRAHDWTPAPSIRAAQSRPSKVMCLQAAELRLLQPGGAGSSREHAGGSSPTGAGRPFDERGGREAHSDMPARAGASL